MGSLARDGGTGVVRREWRREGGTIKSFMAEVVRAGQDLVKFMTGNDNLGSSSPITFTVYIMSRIVFNYHYRGKSNCLIEGWAARARCLTR